jgi:hypothetical protein
MPSTRRGILVRLLKVGAGGAVALRASAGAAKADDSELPKVAYHLCDVEKVTFVLGNIENHIAGMGGRDKVRIVLVVHGPALTLFQTSKALPTSAVDPTESQLLVFA